MGFIRVMGTNVQATRDTDGREDVAATLWILVVAKARLTEVGERALLARCADV